MGALAAFGIVLTSTNVAWGRKIASALYLVLGWSVLVASPALIDHLDGRELTLMIAGGLLYTIGFPVLALNRPDPWPRTFGYHEIWHVFTVLAAASHFVAVASIVS
jgi:hemolysin III